MNTWIDSQCDLVRNKNGNEMSHYIDLTHGFFKWKERKKKLDRQLERKMPKKKLFVVRSPKEFSRTKMSFREKNFRSSRAILAWYIFIWLKCIDRCHWFFSKITSYMEEQFNAVYQNHVVYFLSFYSGIRSVYRFIFLFFYSEHIDYRDWMLGLWSYCYFKNNSL